MGSRSISAGKVSLDDFPGSEETPGHVIVDESALPDNAAQEEDGHLESIDGKVATEETLDELNQKVENDFGAAAQAIRVAAQLADAAANHLTSAASGARRGLDIVRVSESANRYSNFISVRQSAATAAGAVVWAFRNNESSRSIFIDHFDLQVMFDTATPLARSYQRYSVVRFSGATPTGGSSITPCPLDTTTNDAVVDIRTATTGLTIPGGLVQAQTLMIPGTPAVDGSNISHEAPIYGLQLRPGEGILISLLVTAVVGQCIGGYLFWRVGAS